MSDLHERILQAIAKSTSQHPSKAAAVLAKIGGDAEQAQAALDALIRDRLIATARITRPKVSPEPWLAIWPTGLKLAAGGWTGSSHSGLFVQTGDSRVQLRAAHAPRSTPAPASIPVEKPEARPRTRRDGDARRAAILDLVRGRCAADGLTINYIAEQVGITSNGVGWLLAGMLAADQVARTSSRPAIFHDPAAERAKRAEAQARLAQVHGALAHNAALDLAWGAA